MTTRQRAEFALASIVELRLQREELDPGYRAAEIRGHGPVTETVRTDVGGAREKLAGLDPCCSVRTHERGATGETEPLLRREMDTLRQRTDERAAERKEDDDLADLPPLGDDLHAVEGRRPRNRRGREGAVRAHPPGEPVRPLRPGTEKLELDAPRVGEPIRRSARLGGQAPVGVTRGGEASDQAGVGIVALALGRIASEPPGCDGERRREQQERGDEPKPAGPGAESRAAPGRRDACGW